jgi:hypothetical protein
MRALNNICALIFMVIGLIAIASAVFAGALHQLFIAGMCYLLYSVLKAENKSIKNAN